jgi:hypothetical protein
MQRHGDTRAEQTNVGAANKRIDQRFDSGSQGMARSVAE